jgi:AraC family transcriptional regulator of adaptative response / DNA-3-methyladenine glycosylase II
MRAGTGETPTEIRRLRNAPHEWSVPTPGLSIRLPYRPPLHWQGLLAFFAARALAQVEFVSPNAYWRTITIGGVAGVIEVHHDNAERQLIVAIELPRYESLMQVVERVRRMFDLTADPLQIADRLSRDRILQPYFAANLGLRVPGIWDGFEAAVRVVLGERLTTKAPNSLLSELIRTFGKPIKTSVRSLTHTFPGPENLAEADLEEAGICSESARTIRALARAVLRRDLTFESSVSLQETTSRLRILPGISGPMADYIAMRAYGEPDAFPAPAGMAERDTENWRPWRAYAAMYLFGGHLKR